MVAVFAIVKALIGALLAAMKPRACLVAENLALRQQLAIVRRTTPRPRLRPIDRAFWALLSRTWVALGRCARNREACHGGRLASPRICTVLGDEVEARLVTVNQLAPIDELRAGIVVD
jgi:hypothetical protein